MVPEEQAGQALELLSASPQILSEHEELPRCPYCQSADVDSRPPYALIALGVGFACSAIATVYRRYTMAFVIGVLTAALATLMQVNVPRWRCRICGREYGTMSGR
jgi:Flp pilus assembly protein TadB